MPNQDDRELESILRETPTPSRADGKEIKKAKVKEAKLTGRTIGSLRRKIKEKRMDRAYRKYNENYRKMRSSLKEANEIRYAQEKGDNITDSEIALAYDEVAKYGKKLAKYGAVLLEDDIAKVAANSKVKPKPIRVPRIFVGVARKMLRLRDKHKTKKAQKAMAKDIKGATKDFIKESLDSALFVNREDRELRDQLDRTVIQDLGVKKGVDTAEDRLASLRKFISKDGETSLFGDEIAKREKPTTDVPPIAPTPTVPKEEKVMTEQDLLGDLATKKPLAPETEVTPTKKEEPKVTEQSLFSGMNPSKPLTIDDMLTGIKKSAPQADVPKVEQPVEPVKEEPKVELTNEESETINRRQREVNVILSLQNSLSQLEQQAKEVTDPRTKELIDGYIKSINNEFENIIRRGTKETKDKKEVQASNETLEPIEVQPKEEEKVQETVAPTPKVEQPVEPVKEEPVMNPQENVENKEHNDDNPTIGGVPVSAPSQDGFRRTPSGLFVPNSTRLDSELKNVEVKESRSMRAEQISRPAALRVTQEDIKKMEERNKNAQQTLADLTQQRKELEEQKKMLQDYISVAKTTRDAEMRAQEMSKSNAELASEVAELSSQRAAIDADLGRTR